MSSKYEVELISIENKNVLMRKYSESLHYEERADIYECCIKLLTESKYVKERWEENFYPMSAHVRSHGCPTDNSRPYFEGRPTYSPKQNTCQSVWIIRRKPPFERCKEEYDWT